MFYHVFNVCFVMFSMYVLSTFQCMFCRNYINKKTAEAVVLASQWWLRPELNRRHTDFQSVALPTELPSQQMAVSTGLEPAISCVTGRHVDHYTTRPFIWLRGRDLNSRPSGYEPDELPDCSTPRYKLKMAEEVGFEPTRALTPSGFQDRPLQPLGYSSVNYLIMQSWWTR